MNDTDKTFPYTAWRLTPSFKPVECEVVEHGRWYGTWEWRRLSTGGRSNADDIYATKADAISAGRAKVEAQEQALAKKRASLDKKIAALDKAEAA